MSPELEGDQLLSPKQKKQEAKALKKQQAKEAKQKKKEEQKMARQEKEKKKSKTLNPSLTSSKSTAFSSTESEALDLPLNNIESTSFPPTAMDDNSSGSL